MAIQAAIINTINEGVRKGHWSFKEEQIVQQKKEEVEGKTSTENK
mgnify:CR=1 FL=1